jgi:hypothetical protein
MLDRRDSMLYNTYSNYGYTTSYDTASAAAGAGVFAVFGVFYLIFFIVAVALAVVEIVGMWKVFTKAGKEGWKSLIPIYNIYTLCEIIGVSP